MTAKKSGSKASASSFGEKIKKLREGEGVTLDELAAQVGMKPKYLKDIEEDRFLPPVAEILTLARTLSVDPTALMGQETAGASPARKYSARSRRTNDYAYEVLSSEDEDKHLMAFRVTIDPRSKHRKVGYSHEGEEFIYVLSGVLKISVAGKVSNLEAGESIHFDSAKKHHLGNPGDEPTVLIVVLLAK